MGLRALRALTVLAHPLGASLTLPLAQDPMSAPWDHQQSHRRAADSHVLFGHEVLFGTHEARPACRPSPALAHSHPLPHPHGPVETSCICQTLSPFIGPNPDPHPPSPSSLGLSLLPVRHPMPRAGAAPGCLPSPYSWPVRTPVLPAPGEGLVAPGTTPSDGLWRFLTGKSIHGKCARL